MSCMAYVIDETCAKDCNEECKNACPVEAIHGPHTTNGRLHLLIDPDACICCAACEPVCPARAIFDGDA